MKITSEILGFLFWIYLVEIKYPRNRVLVDEIFNKFADEIIGLFNYIVNDGHPEVYCLFEDCGINLKRNGKGFILRMEFKSEEEAKNYREALKRYRTFDPKDLLIFRINPKDSIDLGAQLNLLFKSEKLTWELTRKSIEIKIGDG